MCNKKKVELKSHFSDYEILQKLDSQFHNDDIKYSGAENSNRFIMKRKTKKGRFDPFSTQIEGVVTSSAQGSQLSVIMSDDNKSGRFISKIILCVAIATAFIGNSSLLVCNGLTCANPILWSIFLVGLAFGLRKLYFYLETQIVLQFFNDELEANPV